MLTAFVITSVILGAGAAADIIEPIGGDMGTYRVHCNVEAAIVYFDGEFKGTITGGILDVPVNITGTPYRSFSIEKEGYYPYSGQFTSVPANGSVVDVYATMSGIPPVEYGTVHLLVSPALSSVSLDGESMGLVPETGILIIRDVVPGNHVAQVSRQGYADATNEFHISKHEIKKVSITLAATDNGPLSVSSTPPGAQVFLDGQSVGATPLSLSGVREGQHNIVLTLEGYKNYTGNVSVNRDGATVSASLVPGPSTGGSSIGLSPFTLMGALLGAFLLLGLKWHHK